MNKRIALVVVLVFIMGISVVSLGADAGFVGVVTSIKGDKVTVKDDAGRTKIIATTSKGFKVGDQVTVSGKKIQCRSVPPDPFGKDKGRSDKVKMKGSIAN
jgi:small-conductance mechanosensitive channel